MTEVMALVDKDFKTTTVNIRLHSYKGTHIYKGMNYLSKFIELHT